MKKILPLILSLSILTAFSQDYSLVKHVISNLKINNEYSNFGTAFYGKNKIVYSSHSSGKLNLYSGDFTGGEIENIKPFAKLIRENTHESNIAITNDYKTVYFTRSIQGKKNTKKTKKNRKATIAIYKATLSENGTWKNIEPLPFNSNKYDVAHPSLNKENTKLYFTSNMPGTIGNNDIFVVDIYASGKYSKPRNLGPKVNTKGKEMFPYISEDNFLYFSSNGHQDSYGNLDIYYVQINGNKTSKTIHFDKPINSKWDDFAYIFNPEIRQGFFSSNRPGKGKDDIYFVREVKNIKENKLVSELENEEEKEKKKCVKKIRGVVYNSDSSNVVSSTLVKLKDNNGRDLKAFLTKSSARYYFNLKCNKNYKIEASRNDFLLQSKSINSSLDNTIIKNNFFLEKKEKIVEQIGYNVVEKINFDFNNSGLLKRYSYKLDKATLLLKGNSDLFIEIESHTDSRGDAKKNMNLTIERVGIIKNYLKDKGILNEQIKSTAFGEGKPLNKCIDDIKCSNNEHLINRRTTFVLKQNNKITKNKI